VTRRQLLASSVGFTLPIAAEAVGTPETKILAAGKARLEAAKRGLEQFDLGSGGGADCSLVRMWARRVVDAELALCPRRAERKNSLEVYVRRSRNAERVVRAGHKAGAVALAEVLEAEFCRADAEALLAEEEVRQAGGD
jgi:hypothetical protein